MPMTTYTGLLCEHHYGPDYKPVMYISSLLDPLMEELEWVVGKQAAVRYWVTDQKVSKAQAIAAFVREACGIADGQLRIGHGEMTGPYMIERDFKVGGHNVMAELREHLGRWIILEIETEDAG